MRLRILTVALVCLVCAVSWISLAQQAEGDAPPGAGQEVPDSGITEEVKVLLVEVPIRARTAAGKAVTDLTAEEIVIKGFGEKMRVAFLEPFYPERDATEVPEVRLLVEAADRPTREPVAGGGSAQHYAIFVDVENDSKLGRPEALQKVLEFVREHFDADDRYAVFSFNGQLNIETPFTNDLPSVLAGVESAYTRPATPRLDMTRRILDLIELLENCVVNTGSFVASADSMCLRDVVYNYADQTRPVAASYLDGLDGLLQYLGGLPGRKTVFALSHGYAAEPNDDLMAAAGAVFGQNPDVIQEMMSITAGEGARIELDRLMATAVQRGITLHFIDRNPTPSVATSARLGREFQPGARPVQSAHIAAQDDVEELATQSGGIFIASPDLSNGLEQAWNIERGGYAVGYYLDFFVPPEKLGKIKIKSTRRGVKISHRRGFYKRFRDFGTIQGKIGLGKPQGQGESPGGPYVPFVIQAQPENIGYRKIGEAAEATITLNVQVLWDDGRPLVSSYHLISHAYPVEAWDAGQVQPLLIRGWMQAPPGNYTLEAMIRNPINGREGRLIRDVAIPGS